MDIKEFVGVLRRRWLIATFLTLAGVGTAAAVTASAQPLYEATVETFVSLRHGSGAATVYQDNLFSQARVKSYAEIVDSPEVTDDVVRRLHLPMSGRQLAARISATAPAETVLVDIKVRDTSPTRARDVADAVGLRFATAVERLEAPNDGSPSPVAVRIVRPAELPISPASPRVPLNLGIGLLVGACVGLAAAVLRDLLDSSVKTREDLAALTGSGPLGVIAFDSRARRRPLAMEADRRAARSEAFRALRTNLRFVDVDRPPRVVVVTSCGMGEGKSTTACNLAVTMASAGARVVLVDADLRRPSAADYLGLEGSVGLTDVLTGRSELGEVLQTWGGLPLHVLASGPLPPNPSELLGSAQMAELLARLRSRADFVLLDTPPLLPVTDAAVLAAGCDGAILVVRHGRTDRRQVAQAVEILHRINARVLGTVLTMAPARAGTGYGRYARGYHAGSPAGQRRLRRLRRAGAASAAATIPAGAADGATPDTASTPAG